MSSVLLPSPSDIVRVLSSTFAGNTWLTHLEPRRWQPLQMELVKSGSKVHFIFLRLHSQQLLVPFRTLRFVP